MSMMATMPRIHTSSWLTCDRYCLCDSCTRRRRLSGGLSLVPQDPFHRQLQHRRLHRIHRSSWPSAWSHNAPKSSQPWPAMTMSKMWQTVRCRTSARAPAVLGNAFEMRRVARCSLAPRPPCRPVAQISCLSSGTLTSALSCSVWTRASPTARQRHGVCDETLRPSSCGVLGRLGMSESRKLHPKGCAELRRARLQLHLRQGRGLP